MASSEQKAGYKDVIPKAQEFCALAGSKDKTLMTSKACGKMVADCLEKDYKKFEIKNVIDASVFPKCKEKGKPHMVVNKASMKLFLGSASHEVAKKKTKDNKLDPKDPKVKEIRQHMKICIAFGGPHVKKTEISSKGNVSGLTDASKYTGAHKERFDSSGKGKGIEGRVDKQDDSGYVGNYKGAGSFDQKK